MSFKKEFLAFLTDILQKIAILNLKSFYEEKDSIKPKRIYLCKNIKNFYEFFVQGIFFSYYIGIRHKYPICGGFRVR